MSTVNERTASVDVATGNHGSLRHQNITSILRLIYRDRPISRVELSRITGLNKATVSSLVSELLESGCVRSIGENQSERAGRREVLIDIDPQKTSAVSMEIGIGNISVIAADFAGETISRSDVTFDLNLTAGRVISKAARMANDAAAEAESLNGKVAGISIAVPGAVDIETGNVLFAPNLGWRDVPILERLKAKISHPVLVDNEASLAALGEHFFGAAKGLRGVLYISAGVGLGGGLIVDGDIYRGSSGIAGEFGHMTVDIGGKPCSCGKNGCWETAANEAALFSEYRRLMPRAKNVADRSQLIDQILISSGAGEECGIKALEFIARPLAVGIDSLIKAFDPERIVLGGPLSSFSKFLIPMISRELQQRRIFGVDHCAEVVAASFGPDAALKGGVARVIRSFLRTPAI
ncbi:MAG: ROK family transcriptional regulator [bacterium]|nr:ROK family transcriptional regulator [bacterium]